MEPLLTRMLCVWLANVSRWLSRPPPCRELWAGELGDQLFTAFIHSAPVARLFPQRTNEFEIERHHPTPPHGYVTPPRVALLTLSSSGSVTRGLLCLRSCFSRPGEAGMPVMGEDGSGMGKVWHRAPPAHFAAVLYTVFSQ